LLGLGCPKQAFAKIATPLQLADRIIEFDPDVRGGQGYAIARDILESGRALEKMNALIKAQGSKPINLRPSNLSQKETFAKRPNFMTDPQITELMAPK
jgi:thymidine phosphorylase